MYVTYQKTGDFLCLKSNLLYDRSTCYSWWTSLLWKMFPGVWAILLLAIAGLFSPASAL